MKRARKFNRYKFAVAMVGWFDLAEDELELVLESIENKEYWKLNDLYNSFISRRS